jgi:hypothetical protein
LQLIPDVLRQREFGKLVDPSTESADRKRLAAGAIAKLSRTKKGTSKPPPDVEVGALDQKAEQKQS